MRSALYYECYITIEPVFGRELEKFRRLSARHRFRAGELLMQKRKRETPTRSDKDAFCTGRGGVY